MALFDNLFGMPAWRRDHEAIVQHARQIGYPGKIADINAPKGEWISFADDLNAWKKKTFAPTAPAATPVQSEESPSAPSFTPQADPYAGMGPAIYPMTTPSYTPPSAQDFSAYTSMSPFGGEGGLLYQPWSAEYLNRYVPQSLLNYTPPELSLARPTYMPNPLGLMELIYLAEEEVEDDNGSKDPKKSDDNDDLDQRGGPDGYDPDRPGHGDAAAEASDKSGEFGDPGVATGQHVG
jgi:hypothetical protein